MDRSEAIAPAGRQFDSGEFRRTLAEYLIEMGEETGSPEGLQIMTGLYWDLGCGGTPWALP